MSQLAPYPLGALARRMFQELEQRESVFDLPARKFVVGDPHHDFAVRFHHRPAATPFGPSAGPHTQMAQNIALSWLAGARILELKTVQVNDALTIPRPCIDMQTVGYNVEWSQELTLEQSLEEYVKGAMLVRMLVASGRLPLAPGFEHTVFDLSVGYDLAGLRSERVQAFIRGMMDATPVVDRLRRQLPAELGPLRDCDFDTRVSGTLTLSTFHGCPPDEIERMVEFLMRELGLACVVKLNPTLLGAAAVRELLHDALGYTELSVPGDAFAKDTTWEQAADFVGRLGETAARLGLGFGIKLSNTLIVENHRDYFPPSERVMYLSGPPLHVLAMHLVRRFRRGFGDRYPISFSAGVDRHNFPDAVALGLVPVTVCSDLLKPGGYGRAAGYFAELARRMDAAGAASIGDFILRAYAGDSGAPGSLEAAASKLRNTEAYVERVTNDPRYRAEHHRRVPRKIGRRLELLDCLTCDKCIPACPNDAIFTYVLEGAAEPHQLASFADFCNDCGNCDVFCPEDGGPQILKPRIFVSRERYLADAPRDAILIEPGGVAGRFGGVEYRGDQDSTWSPFLNQLREAVLASSEANYVRACL